MNPFEPPSTNKPINAPVAKTPKPDIVDGLLALTSLLLGPMFIGILYVITIQFLQGKLGWDERYVSLTLGVPSAMVAIGIAVYYWGRGQRVLPILGSIFWCGWALFTLQMTIAFWGG